MVKVYIFIVRPLVEYACQLWHAGLADFQCQQIESVQVRALHLSYPQLSYEEALSISDLPTLESRRKQLCQRLFSDAIAQHLYNHHYCTIFVHNRMIMLNRCTFVALCDDTQHQPTIKITFTVLLHQCTILQTHAFHHFCHNIPAKWAGSLVPATLCRLLLLGERWYVSLRYPPSEKGIMEKLFSKVPIYSSYIC